MLEPNKPTILEMEPVRPDEDAHVRIVRFWIIFCCGYLLGALAVDMADDFVHRWRTGFHNDGGILIVTLVFFPVVWAAGMLGRMVLPQGRTVAFAWLFPMIVPLTAYGVIVLLSL